MSLQQLFEDWPLYKPASLELTPNDVFSANIIYGKVVSHKEVVPTAVQFDCSVCKTSRTLTKREEKHLADFLIGPSGGLNFNHYGISASYTCQSCLRFYAYFLIVPTWEGINPQLQLAALAEVN